MVEEKTQQISEEQLIQMAQQDEQELMQKQSILQRLLEIHKEATNAKETLKELQITKGKIWVAVGATILIEVQPTNTEKCKMGLSENGYKDTTTEEATKWLEEREIQLKRQIETLQKEINEGQNRLTQIISIIKQIEQEKRKQLITRPPTISK